MGATISSIASHCSALPLHRRLQHIGGQLQRRPSPTLVLRRHKQQAGGCESLRTDATVERKRAAFNF